MIIPAIEKWVTCGNSEVEHKPEGHTLELDKTLQWRGWHRFRRGLEINLQAIHVDDKTMQAILRHSNIGLTMNV